MDYAPSLINTISCAEAKQLNPLVLAFVGDSVQTLYVRTKLTMSANQKAGGLHKLASLEVCATAQADAVQSLIEIFTSDEADIYRRARNSKSKSAAKNADIIDYHKASGYEAVLGYLYLTGQHERLDYLLNYVKGES